MKKLVIVTNIPNPYRIPLFNEIERQAKELGINFHVIFGASGYKRRQYQLDMKSCNFSYEFLDSGKMELGEAEKTLFYYNGLLKAIQRLQPDCIVINGFSMGTLQLYWRSLWKKTPYVIWSGTVSGRGKQQSKLRVWQRRILLSRAKGFVAYGKMAADYLTSLGAATEKIFIARNTVDTSFFSNEAEKIKASQKRIELRFRFIYVGFIIRKKNLEVLLDAVKYLRTKRSDFVLELVGSGADEAYFQDYVRQHDLTDQVIFSGYVQKPQLPAHLAGADCFVFPSNYDIWGLVVNEAMACGLPCISSVQSGVTSDLIRDGENGFAVDFTNSHLVAEKMNWMIEHPDLAAEMGKKGKGILEELASLEVSARGVIQAAQLVMNP